MRYQEVYINVLALFERIGSASKHRPHKEIYGNLLSPGCRCIENIPHYNFIKKDQSQDQHADTTGIARDIIKPDDDPSRARFHLVIRSFCVHKSTIWKRANVAHSFNACPKGFCESTERPEAAICCSRPKGSSSVTVWRGLCLKAAYPRSRSAGGMSRAPSWLRRQRPCAPQELAS